MVLCSKCKTEIRLSDAYIIRNENGSEIGYECFMNTRKCREKCNELEKVKLEEEKKEREKYKDLSQEEKIKAQYGVNFDDLIESDERYRDASDHFVHRETGKIYSWNYFSNYWYTKDKCGEELEKISIKVKQIKEKYDVYFDDLIELPERYKDASIHYKHKETGKKYSWNYFSKYWYD
jgi:hypothetical protein